MPARVQLYKEWRLRYSLEQHGISLHTLYRCCNPEKKSEGYAASTVRHVIGEGPEIRPRLGYVLVILDTKGHLFGCYLNEHLRPQDSRRYYGNGESFLWKWGNGQFQAFMYTGLNDNVVYSNHDFLAVGSLRGDNGLWVDALLARGVSYPCETFGNESLSGGGAFEVVGVEFWQVGH